MTEASRVAPSFAVCSALVVLVLDLPGLGCGKKGDDGDEAAPGAVAAIEAIADRACACNDNACGIAASEELELARRRFDRELEKGRRTKEGRAEMQTARQRVMSAVGRVKECLIRFPLGRAPPELADLWSRFQAAYASPGAAEKRGRAIHALLTTEARKIVGDAVGATLAVLRRNEAAARMVPSDPQDLVYRALGEVALAKQADVARLRLHKAEVSGDTATLVVFEDRREAMRLRASRENDGWRLDFAPELMADETSVFRPPATGDPGPATGISSPEKLAAAWRKVVNEGDGWQAYHLFSAASQTKLKEMVAAMGGSGAADVVRILEKTIRDRQARGQTARSVTATEISDERARVEVVYTGGNKETFEAVRERGEWRLVAPF